MDFNDFYPLFISSLTKVNHLWHSIPGSTVIGKYVQNSYQHDPFRVVLELLLFFFALKYLLSKRYSPSSTSNDSFHLSEREIDELVDDWIPEPLVTTITNSMHYFNTTDEINSIPILSSGGGPKVKLEGSNRTLINLASFDIYGLANSDRIKDKAIIALRKYGVGACNPPGFYGTMDVHMQLERDIAQFLHTDHAILYAQGFSAIASVVPAFSKRGDLVVVDESVSFALQKGFQISRSRVITFKHNDMIDLELKIAAVAAEDKRLKRPLYRKFILVEGIYANLGDLAPLPQLIDLKNRFKYRLIIDESCSFGILGAKGRGLTEHFGISSSQVDMIVGSLANSVGASGGFCAGSLPVIEHQRLSAQAYVFSAALPPMLAVAASEGISFINKEGPELLPLLLVNLKLIRDILEQVPYLNLISSPHSPLQHLCVNRHALPPEVTKKLQSENSGDTQNHTTGSVLPPPKSSVLSLLAGSRPLSKNRGTLAAVSKNVNLGEKKYLCYEQEAQFLQDIVKECMDNGVLITRSKYATDQEYNCPRLSIKIIVSATLNKKEAEQAAKTIKSAAIKVTQTWSKSLKN